MRVLLVSNVYPTASSPNGGVYVTRRMQALRRRGVAFDAFAITPAAAPAGPDSTFQSVAFESSLSQRLAARLVYPGSLIERLGEEIVSRTSKHRYDVIQAHGAYHPPAAGVAEVISRQLRIPFVVTLHGSDVNLTMRHHQRAYARLLARASRVVYVSEALKASATHFGAPEHNALVIPNGVDTSVFKVTGHSKLYDVVFVGGLSRVKGADRLPAIFHTIAHERPETRFAIVGDGALRPRLTRSLSGLGDRLSFLGALPQREVAAVLARSRCLILPSRSEGWPCTILEAHASGCMVIGTDVGGVREAIGSGEHVVPGGRSVSRLLSGLVVAKLNLNDWNAAPHRQRSLAFDWDSLASRELAMLTAADNCPGAV